MDTKTCPFDEMITKFDGIIECINDDFEYLCDSRYLEMIRIPSLIQKNPDGDWDRVIYNTKYKFIFNHESPDANLHDVQKWEKGRNHYLLNDYEELKKRYKQRIENMKELLNSGKNINFILTCSSNANIKLLKNTIEKKYPNLVFNILNYNTDEKKYEEFIGWITFAEKNRTSVESKNEEKNL